MERQQILATMGELKLFSMKAAFDEIIKIAVKRAHEPQKIVGDLLQAEIAETGNESWRFNNRAEAHPAPWILIVPADQPRPAQLG